MSDNTDSRGTWNRRQVITALGAAGVLGASSTATASDVSVGGGSMSDPISHLNLEWYEGPEDELPSPGVEGRYYRVTSGGALWNTGDVLEDTGDQWVKTNIGSWTEDADGNLTPRGDQPLSVEETQSDVVDTYGLTGGWGLNIEGPFSASRLDLINDERLTPHSQVVSVSFGLSSPTIFADDTQDKIYKTTPSQTIEEVGTVGATAGDPLKFAMATVRDNWLVIQGTASEPYTAYLYDSPAGIDDTSNAVASQADVWNPRKFDAVTVVHPDNGQQIIWAEYGTIDRDAKVWKASFDTPGITDVLSDSNIDHFHNLEVDPYNEGTLYVTSGDGVDQRYWWKSTDYGDTWSKLPVGDNQSTLDPRTWKTVRIAFTADHLYWGVDGNVGTDTDGNDDQYNATRFYRAPRDDLSNPEELFNYATTPWGDYNNGPRLQPYGLCYLEKHDAILITHREADDVGDTVPAFVWDLKHDKLRRVQQLSATTGGLGGIPFMGSYVDNNMGWIPSAVHQYDTWRTTSSSRNWDEFAAHGISLTHLME